jgi:MraZ protein
MELPLLGTWECRIDDKRRLTLPARLRELLSSVDPSPELIVTRGDKGCLLIIPPKIWKEFSPDLFRAIVGGDEDAQRLRATMAVYGSVSRIDNTGRITLTDKQVRVAGLAKGAILLGNFNRVELWNSEQFAAEFPELGEPRGDDRLAARYLDGMATPKEKA